MCPCNSENLTQRTGSVSDCYVLFFDREKGQLNALLQVAQVSLTVVLFMFSCEYLWRVLHCLLFACLPILLLWQHYLKNGLCSLRSCRCWALAEVRRVNKVGLFSSLLYELALVLFENFHIEHAASYFYLCCLSLLDNLVMCYTVTQSVSLDCCL